MNRNVYSHAVKKIPCKEQRCYLYIDAYCLYVFTMLDWSPIVHRCLLFIYVYYVRLVAKTKQYGRRMVMYRSPCGRRLRSLDEIEQYLQATNCHLAVDNFCCDVELHVHHEFIPVKVKLIVMLSKFKQMMQFC